MGCSASKTAVARVRVRDHEAISLLMALDDHLYDTLRSGAIKLIIAGRIRDGTIGTKIARRQDLEARERSEGIRIFHTPKDAIKLLRSNKREISSLTYGWDTPDGSDPSGEYLRAISRFLRSGLGAHVQAVFWDACSLPQEPRSESDAKVFAQALEVMADMYASVLGTMVIRHRSVPSRPASLDGEVVVREYAADKAAHPDHICSRSGMDPIVGIRYHKRGTDYDLCQAEYDKLSAKEQKLFEAISPPGMTKALTAEAVRCALEAYGKLDSLRHDKQGFLWRARFASHADAERAVAAGLFEGATAVFTYHNPRPYGARGWTTLESAVSTEGIAQAAYLPGLKTILDRLPPKLVEIDGEAPEPSSEQYGGSEGLGPRIERVRLNIRNAFFTGKGDKTIVKDLYDEYITRIANTMSGFGGEMLSEYDGERNAAGEEEGRGTMRYGDGTIYEGEWKDGQTEGHGVYRCPDGDVYDGEFKAGERNGRGTMRYSDSAVYEGEWKADDRHGRGTMRYADGDVYEGEWKENTFGGHGTLREADGDMYEGEWKADDRHGRGMQRYADGDVYEGEWKEDKFGGHGTLREADGDVYEGEWLADQKNGRGMQRYADGAIYEGEWKADEKNGRGTMRYADGDVYEGEWKADAHEGRGSLRSADGSVLHKGMWKAGESVTTHRTWPFMLSA